MAPSHLLLQDLMNVIQARPLFTWNYPTKGLVGPDGRVHHYAPSTIEKWYLDYQNHGFDALIPKGRSDAGMSRKLDDELQERIRYFKTNYPRMSATAIYRQLKNDGFIIKRTGFRIHSLPLRQPAPDRTAADSKPGYAPL